MKKLILTLLLLATVTARAEVTWLTDLDAAKAQGVKENKPVLVDFTGSDWCPPCKTLHKIVFESAEFAAAASQYVLVELDFPNKKPQTPELKAKNREWQKKYGITGYPTVLLLDAKSGEVFGKTVGFGGQTAQAYLDKLASFKNTPEGKMALDKEQKDAAASSAKRSELGKRITAAVAAKDFPAAEAALEEMFVDDKGSQKAILAYNKARILIQIDPAANLGKAMKYMDEAIVLAADNEALSKSYKAVREKILSGGVAAPTPAPKGATPKASADPKKGA